VSDPEVKRIFIPEVTRVEGHAAVDVEVKDGEVTSVKLDVFEGTRYFEKIVLGHHFSEIPHITSRVCAICSTGHVIAAINALESIFQFQPSATTLALRELMHLGMIIESHATHIYALALPDFLGIPDLLEFATKHQDVFQQWTFLRSLGAEIQTLIGGRPFHPVNLQVGGFSSYPAKEQLLPLLEKIENGIKISTLLASIEV
jgi:sulfhydrogenase subunit alpha